MQQQLIEQITQRVGIPADKAQAAVETVVGYLKQRLPGPVASQLDSAVSGDDSGESGGIAGAAKNIGGMFGGKQQ
jgi:hypothetical protein